MLLTYSSEVGMIPARIQAGRAFRAWFCHQPTPKPQENP
jgi:hypothetical protein